MVSIIIPSCNERYLRPTVVDLLTRARGEIEILVVLDGGPWPDLPLPDDARVRVLRHDTMQGMRPSINEAADVARGEYLLKCDGHCAFAEGYDVTLVSACDGDDVLVVPTRHSLDAEHWRVKTRDYNYHYLTFPYATTMYGVGLHAKTFDHYHRGADGLTENERLNAERVSTPIDDLMSFQGSCWLQPTALFRRLGPLDTANLYFYQEAQEVGLRVWMTGGRCVIDKRTWYAHYHKGRDNAGADGRRGRGFFLDLKRKRSSELYAADWWLHDRQPGATRTWASFIAQFWPLLSRVTGPDRWPDDWDHPRHAEAFFSRPPEQIPAHT